MCEVLLPATTSAKQRIAAAAYRPRGQDCTAACYLQQQRWCFLIQLHITRMIHALSLRMTVSSLTRSRAVQSSTLKSSKERLQLCALQLGLRWAGASAGIDDTGCESFNTTLLHRVVQEPDVHLHATQAMRQGCVVSLLHIAAAPLVFNVHHAARRKWSIGPSCDMIHTANNRKFAWQPSSYARHMHVQMA